VKPFTLSREGATEIVFPQGRGDAEMPRLVEPAPRQDQHSDDVNALVRVRHALRELRALRLCANPSSFLRVFASPREQTLLRAFAPSRENRPASTR
jgi:hypothetical protein